ILTGDHQRVVLPDMAAGCSMADMATASQVEQCWEDLTAAGIAQDTVPMTYMNSSAAIKGFVGREGGVVCTSSNAERALRWAFERVVKVLFLPDQHLCLNSVCHHMGFDIPERAIFITHSPLG